MLLHTPVMLEESLHALNMHEGGTYIDLTFGGGGHTKAMLQRITTGSVFAFDQDQAAAQAASSIAHERFTFIKANARFMTQFLAFYGVHQVDGILADLGVSSHQLDTADRGFAARLQGVLDMRMDQANDLTAQIIINDYTAVQLKRLLQHYGEIPNASKLSKAIVDARVVAPLRTTNDLKNVLHRWAPRGKEFKYYAKVFQALRIEVNDELGALKQILQQSIQLLRPGGKLVVLSYHSLEDRLVKRFLNMGNFEGVIHQDIYGNLLRPLRPMYRKPLKPSAKEIESNPRARSARLRAGEVM